jgi:hypothetical protein
LFCYVRCAIYPSRKKDLFVLRTLSAVAIGAALLGLSALPASAAPVSHPKVHTFTLPAVTGLHTWGSYSRVGSKAHITLCVKETASDVDVAVAVAVAMNASVSKHQAIQIEIIGSGKQECRSLVTSDTAHLYAEATSGTTNGKSHLGKDIKIY